MNTSGPTSPPDLLVDAEEPSVAFANGGSPLAFTPHEADRILSVTGSRHPDSAHDGRPVAVLEADEIYEMVRARALSAAYALNVGVGNWAHGKVLEYPASQGGIDWHTDNGTGLAPLAERALVNRGVMQDWQLEEMRGRTLSVMVQLSEADAYEGGALEVKSAAGRTLVAPRQRGTAVYIGADRPHRVTEITRGCRLSLVVFFGTSPRATRS